MDAHRHRALPHHRTLTSATIRTNLTTRGPQDGEGVGGANAQFRRSLYVVADVKAGEILTEEQVRSIRPGNGLAPKHLDDILGKPAARDLQRGEPFAWDMIAS